MAYDPNQPRAPAGQSNGGQWIATGNPGYGFHGEMQNLHGSRNADEVYNRAAQALKRIGMDTNDVRQLLDSRAGRHIADEMTFLPGTDFDSEVVAAAAFTAGAPRATKHYGVRGTSPLVRLRQAGGAHRGDILRKVQAGSFAPGTGKGRSRMNTLTQSETKRATGMSGRAFNSKGQSVSVFVPKKR